MRHAKALGIRQAATAVVGVMVVGLARDGHASNGIRVETVSDYTYVSGGSTINNTDANTEGNGFWNAMTAAGTGYAQPPVSSHVWDGTVWDTDFYDPQLTGSSADNDSYFDAPNTAIAMFIGHGFCNDGMSRSCQTDVDCPVGAYCPRGTPPQVNTAKACIQQTTRYMQTSASVSSHGNVVTYGTSYGQSAAKSIAFGEDAASGAFGGAGTNGGANVAVLVNSCGIRSRYLDTTTSYMFAGMHLLMMAMPVNAIIRTDLINSPVYYSDTAQWAARGSNFASFVLVNASASAADGWLNPTMVNSGFTSTGSVANNGANVIVTKDATLAKVQFHANNESWVGAQLESNDATGLGYWWNRYLCNYNCSTYGL